MDKVSCIRQNCTPTQSAQVKSKLDQVSARFARAIELAAINDPDRPLRKILETLTLRYLEERSQVISEGYDAVKKALAG